MIRRIQHAEGAVVMPDVCPGKLDDPPTGENGLPVELLHFEIVAEGTLCAAPDELASVRHDEGCSLLSAIARRCASVGRSWAEEEVALGELGTGSRDI